VGGERFHSSKKPPSLRLKLGDGVIGSGKLLHPLDGIEKIHDNEFNFPRNLAAKHIAAAIARDFL
jgi:hypothetical protein